MKNSIQWGAFIIFLFAGIQSYAQLEVRLASLFQDNMVLQQKTMAPVWGWAAPGEEVIVKGNWQNNAVSATTDKSGKWMTRIATPEAGGPYSITIKGSNTISLKNVMIGEVWVCGGQSNMAMQFYREKKTKDRTITYKIDNHEKERLNANYPEIRVFRAYNKHQTSGEKVDTIGGQWLVCAPEMAQRMAAVPYFFGRELHQKLNVPVGLIVNAISATQIEPWTNPEGIASVPQVQEDLNNMQEPLKLKPSALYNSNVHPLVPYAIRGAIWYQGESNKGDHMIYYHKMRALINGWRTAWKQDDFPFYYVQLAPCNGFYKGEMDLPKMWEAQQAALAINNTGMAANTDISDLDLHPANKQDVGKRLAMLALAKDYGKKDIVYYGPRYQSMEIKGNKIHITFDNPEGELMAGDGKPLDYFTIAGANKVFFPAAAQIDVDKVEVYSSKVAVPHAVRFGWKNDARPNLMNADGLPAYPFRTDDWSLDEKNVQQFSEADAFEKANNSLWKTSFEDDCTQSWQERWFLDGEVASVSNDENGMQLTAGPKFKNDAHHMVLWTKESFEGDVKIEYDFTRLDFESRCVNILYIQASGSGEGQFKKDIAEWNTLREVPAMRMYFDHMNAYHISYAAFPNKGDERKSYIRARRYMPHLTGLEGSDLKPDYYPDGLFAPGDPHKITVIKKERDIFMRVVNSEQTYYCHFTNPDLPVIEEGRIGLRLMYMRSSRFTNFKISELKN